MLGRNIPLVIVANKTDLINMREVTYYEGKKFANKLNCPFIECSAKLNTEITIIFYTILIEINKYENDIDLNSISCIKLYKFSIRNSKVLKFFLYIVTIIYIVNTSNK